MQQSTHSGETTAIRLLIVFGMFWLYQFADLFGMMPARLAAEREKPMLLPGAISVILIIVFYSLMTWLAWWLYHDWLRKDRLMMYGRSRLGWWGAMVIYLGIIGLLFDKTFVGAVKMLGAANEPTNQMLVEDLFTQIPIVMTLTTAIGAPIIEEYIFRGLLMASFPHQDRRAWQVLSVVVSSILFGFVHTGFSDILSLPFYALMGTVFAVAYAVTKDLRYPIALHAINNTLSTIMILMIMY